MTEFQRLDIKRLPKASPTTAEDRYWKSFKNPVSHKHFVKVTDLQFSPHAPHDVAACASTRVTLYDPLSLQPSKTITRFREVALSASFRPDGRILSASSQDGQIQSFDLSSRAILRTYSAHTAAVWSVHHGKGYGSLYSAGDDSVVRVWDVASGEETAAWKGHADYVRVVRELPEAEDVAVSGSYDGTVRWWDRRMSAEDACTITVKHGAPVSALVLIPQSSASSSLSCVTAGDVTLKAWDIRYVSSSSSSTSAVSAVHTLSNHQKTITSLTVDASCSRLISASLDSFLKVTALPTMSPLSSIKHASPVLAVALSPDSTTLAIGTVDGTVTLRQRPPPPIPAAPAPLPRMGTQAWFNRGINAPAGPASSVTAPRDRRHVLKAYDVYLKRFQYHQALDAALRTNMAAVVAAMLDELIDRGALTLALSGRDEAGLKAMLAFLLNYLSHPAYNALMVDVMGVVLRVYGGEVGTSVVMDEWVRKVGEKVRDELRVMESMMSMRGGMEMLWRGSERLHQSTDDTQGDAVKTATRSRVEEVKEVEETADHTAPDDRHEEWQEEDDEEEAEEGRRHVRFEEEKQHDEDVDADERKEATMDGSDDDTAVQERKEGGSPRNNQKTRSKHRQITEQHDDEVNSKQLQHSRHESRGSDDELLANRISRNRR